jgi:sialidase-1
MCKNHRSFSQSRDRGESWTTPVLDPTLIEPVCQASLIRFDGKGRANRNRLLFSNPADTKRDNLTVRVSFDGGGTWHASASLYQGPAAYSSLTILKDGAIGCLYERGEQAPYEKLTFARFNIEWVTATGGSRKE